MELANGWVMAIDISLLDSPAPRGLPLEIVERKGIGHPDTICDALAETFSNGLSRFYLERFGAVLHHNVDKALLCGGAARPAFGGGSLLAPKVRLAEGEIGGALTRSVSDVARGTLATIGSLWREAIAGTLALW